MSQAQTFYEGHSLYGGLTWSSVRELIGQGLRERYQVSNELPRKLLALVRKLEAIQSKSLRGRSVIGKFDAIDGNYLLRHAPPLEPRSVGLSDDWLLCKGGCNELLLIGCSYRDYAHGWQRSVDHEQSLQERPSRLVRPNVHAAPSY